jgi:hypothetical protein
MTTKEKKKEYDKKRYLENREKKKEYDKKYYLENKEKIKEHNKKYVLKNKEKVKCREKEYLNRQEVKDSRRIWSREWAKKRRLDPLFRLKCNLRNRTSSAFREGGYSKKSKTNDILGVEWDIVKKHIEKQFDERMTWDNYGEWQIDHIYPLGKANSEEELMELCHYTNLQPLWEIENLSKKDRIVEHQVKLTI